ncbi:hypothetical protein R1sor_001878 [Riccia sorocarpa]|uniref:Reverse transcriptase domain-containing protein n=1 Tax=Riccia sorocarpa TaxID=122646 RepID=A0ABD3GYU2_9MARC
MLLSYWQDGVLTICDAKDVIKLLPKNLERQRLRNWRPITLLTLTYKIISKVLTGRLKKILPGLVDERQTGFVDGRSIHDSILLHRFIQEYAQATKQESVLLKVDFEKAYDRVSHAYLSAVLRQMDFHEDFIQLVTGLLKYGTAVVHTNGLFTKEFKLERGVRQGCPIAPFLFALCTEPLMAMLRSYQESGILEGVKIPGGRQALYNLFADTELSVKATEENYRRVKVLLQQYEEASGAKLNVRKSVMIPVAMEELPLWMTTTGCRIAAKGEVVLHLGFPGGDEVTEGQICSYLQCKLTNRTTMWSNRWLSWSSRIVLAQKILPSLPAYVLMTFGLSKKGYKQLEDAWRMFVWGTRDDGRPKKSAVAWDILQRSRSQGGVQILKLQLHSEAVKIRQISKILEGSTGSWTDIARGFLLRSLATGKQRTEMRKWTAEEALLIGFRMPMKESSTLKNLLQPWYKVRQKLVFDENQGELPDHITINQCLLIAVEKSSLNIVSIVELRKFMKAERIVTMSDLRRLSERGIAHRQGGMERVLNEDINKLFSWVRKIQATTQRLQKCFGWKWKGPEGSPVKRGWIQETKWWKTLLSIEVNSTEKLNRKWDVSLSELDWNKTWSITWKRPSTVRDGFWWWRTLWKGFWTGAQALKANKQNNAALWAVMAEMYRTIWRERCDLVFRGQRTQRPLSAILREARKSVAAWSSPTLSERQRTIAKATLNTLKHFETEVSGGDELEEDLSPWVELAEGVNEEVDTQQGVARSSDSSTGESEYHLQTDRCRTEIGRLVEHSGEGSEDHNGATPNLTWTGRRESRNTPTWAGLAGRIEPLSHVSGEGHPLPVLPDCLFPGH